MTAISARIGERADETLRKTPVIDRVVLVPDAATYVDELAKWSHDDGFWPVLFDDGHYASIFIRRFTPAQVIRREPVGGRIRNADVRAEVEEVLVRAWGGDPSEDTVRSTFEKRQHVPAGAVFACPDDDAWTAAVALAAARGQPILWLDERPGRPNQIMTPARANQLLQQQVDALNAIGLPFGELGDAIDALTFCLEMPGKVDIGAAGGDRDRDLRAITDILGRRPDGDRFAFTGWIFGGEARCAYVAMCSIFLPRDDAWCVNTYPSGEPTWETYGTTDAAITLNNAGFRVQNDQDRTATEEAWLRKIAGGVETDILLMNTKGNVSFFDMSGGGQCYSGDVPVLNRPVIVHMIHSWSAARPADEGTIAGQWLAHGAYAYVGSVQEPFLHAFVPPRQIAERLAAGVPFLISARQWGMKSWRINTFGDPLMTCRPDEANERVAQPAGYGTDLRERLKTLMREADETHEAAAFAGAIELCDLLGEDRIAQQLWRLASESGADSAVARAALPALFRLHDDDEFIRAWFDAAAQDERSRDMLWHLTYPRLSMTVDEDLLLALQGAIREGSEYGDLKRLSPALASTLGAAYARRAVQNEIDRTRSPGERKKLQQLMERIR